MMLHYMTFDGCPFSSWMKDQWIQTLRLRLLQTIFPMCSLSLCMRSIVCFHTKPLVCHLRSVSPSGDDHRLLCPVFQALSGRSLWRRQPPSSSCFTFPSWGNEAVPWDAYGWKQWRAMTEVSVRTRVFNHCLTPGNRGLTFPLARGLPQMLSVSAAVLPLCLVSFMKIFYLFIVIVQTQIFQRAKYMGLFWFCLLPQSHW